jgi:Bor protein
MRTLSLLWACALGLSTLSGCYTTTLRSGAVANPATVAFDDRWHHGLFWGLAELSGPYDLKQICPEGWAEIETETSFINGLLHYLTSGVYASQTVSVRCAARAGQARLTNRAPQRTAAVAGGAGRVRSEAGSSALPE